MTLSQQVQQAYKDEFGTPPKDVRVVRYRACRGGYIKIFPSGDGYEHVLKRQTEESGGHPATHGYIGYEPDARLVRLSRHIKELTGLTNRIYWRKRRGNTPRGYLDVMCEYL